MCRCTLRELAPQDRAGLYLGQSVQFGAGKTYWTSPINISQAPDGTIFAPFGDGTRWHIVAIDGDTGQIKFHLLNPGGYVGHRSYPRYNFENAIVGQCAPEQRYQLFGGLAGGRVDTDGKATFVMMASGWEDWYQYLVYDIEPDCSIRSGVHEEYAWVNADVKLYRVSSDRSVEVIPVQHYSGPSQPGAYFSMLRAAHRINRHHRLRKRGPILSRYFMCRCCTPPQHQPLAARRP